MRQFDDVAESQNNSSKSIELEFTRAELAREEKAFESIANRQLEMQTELRAPSRVQLRQAATVPSEPEARTPYMQLAIACAAAFLRHSQLRSRVAGRHNQCRVHADRSIGVRQPRICRRRGRLRGRSTTFIARPLDHS